MVLIIKRKSTRKVTVLTGRRKKPIRYSTPFKKEYRNENSHEAAADTERHPMPCASSSSMSSVVEEPLMVTDNYGNC